MTYQSDQNKNWVLKHCNKLQNNELQCKYCTELVLTDDFQAKVHLYYKHHIDEDDYDYIDDYIANKRKNLIWEYFKEEEKYAPTCNICNNKFLGEYNLENLEKHLIIKHKETIEILQNIIRMTWIGQHYKFTTLKIITCKICNCVEINIYCIYDVIHHLHRQHNINIETENIVANIRNAINRSIEIARSTSQTSTHLQAETSEDVLRKILKGAYRSTTEDIELFSSQENAPSTSQTYDEYTTNEHMDDILRDLPRQENAPSTSQTSTHLQAEKSKDKSDWNKIWVLKHCNKLQNNELQCKDCNKLVPNDVRAKVHLFRDHNIDEDDNDDYIAKKQKNLIWQYFREEEKYAPTCNICNEKRRSGYVTSNLESHMIHQHVEAIERLQTIIKNTWIGQHYKITWKSYKYMTCKICTDSKDINIYFIYDIIDHLLRQHNINGEIQNTVANIKNAINESIKNAPSTSQTHLQEESEDVPPKKKKNIEELLSQDKY